MQQNHAPWPCQEVGILAAGHGFGAFSLLFYGARCWLNEKKLSAFEEIKRAQTRLP
jgi:hypothetical protein